MSSVHRIVHVSGALRLRVWRFCTNDALSKECINLTQPDTEDGVRQMFYGILDLPEVARVERRGPGKWRVFFGDGSEATAYPLKGRFTEDYSTVKQLLF